MSEPEGESQSRAFAYDDNTDKILSIYELEKGIKDSGVKFDLLYLNAARQGMIEPCYQLKDCTKYLMVSSHSGGNANYSQFLTDLQENDSLSDAIKHFVPTSVNYWVSTYYDGNLSSAATLVHNTLKKMTVAAAYANLDKSLGGEVSIGIVWPTKEFGPRLSKYESYAENLRNSAFCQATGWDKFLLDTDHPKLSAVCSAYYGNAWQYYEGEMSSYEYAWDVWFSIDESTVAAENLETARQVLEEVNKGYGDAVAQYTYPLRHSRGLAEDLYTVFGYVGEERLSSLGVHKIKVHVKLKDGASIDPGDPDADKYPSAVDKEYTF